LEVVFTLNDDFSGIDYAQFQHVLLGCLQERESAVLLSKGHVDIGISASVYPLRTYIEASIAK
jgi:hypothetical protein